MIYPDPNLPWPVPMAAVGLIAECEQGPGGGPALKAYRCPAGVWSIAWGETQNVKAGDTCTKEQADRWLLEDLQERAGAVGAMCTVDPTPAELGAMVSLAYNIGLEGFRKSTVLRQHNAGNRQAAARAFGLWNKARVHGVLTELPGLTARRAREAALYLTGDEPQQAMPQAVEAESKVTASPIARSGAVAAGAGVLEGLRQLGDSVGGIKAPLDAAKAVMVETLGIPPDWILPMVLIAVGVLIVRHRLRQRSEGWA